LALAWAFGKFSLRVTGLLAAAFGMALVTVLVTTGAQDSGGPSPFAVSIWKRPFVASDTLLFYTKKALWPMHQIPIYGRTNEILFSATWIWLTLPVIVGLAFLSPWLTRFARLGLLWWVFSLLPVLGLTPFYYQYMSNVADRYSYTALAGMVILLFAGASWTVMRYPRFQPLVFAGIGCLAIAFGTLAARQSGYWKNSETLWLRQLAINPNVGLAHYLLGVHYQASQQMEKATDEFLTTIKIDPTTPDAYVNLMDIGEELNRPQAIKMIAESALKKLEPTSLDKILVRGHAQIKLGRYPEAIESYRAAAAGLPDDYEIARMLGLAYYRSGNLADAEKSLRRSVGLNDRIWSTHEMLANVLYDSGRKDEAVRFMEQAVSLQPNSQHLQQGLTQMRQKTYVSPLSAER
jgi:protein O-mannosyl-transferase